VDGRDGDHRAVGDLGKDLLTEEIEGIEGLGVLHGVKVCAATECSVARTLHHHNAHRPAQPPKTILERKKVGFIVGMRALGTV
jgi:hypothetical protein